MDAMKIGVMVLACVLGGPALAAPPTTYFLGAAQPFIAEGIARDGGRLFVASVSGRKIVTISGNRQ